MNLAIVVTNTYSEGGYDYAEEYVSTEYTKVIGVYATFFVCDDEGDYIDKVAEIGRKLVKNFEEQTERVGQNMVKKYRGTISYHVVDVVEPDKLTGG